MVAVLVGEEHPADVVGVDEAVHHLEPVLAVHRGAGVDDDRLLAEDHQRVDRHVGAGLGGGQVGDQVGVGRHLHGGGGGDHGVVHGQLLRVVGCSVTMRLAAPAGDPSGGRSCWRPHPHGRGAGGTENPPGRGVHDRVEKAYCERHGERAVAACRRRRRAGHRPGGRRRRAAGGRGHRDRQGRPLRRGHVVRPRPHDAARRVARPHGAPRRRLLQHLLVRGVPRAGRQPLRRPRPGRRLGGDLALGHRRPADAQRPLPRLPAAAGLRRRAAGGVPHRRQVLGRGRPLPRAGARSVRRRRRRRPRSRLADRGGGVPHPRRADGAHARVHARTGADAVRPRRRHHLGQRRGVALAGRDLRRGPRHQLVRDPRRARSPPTSTPPSRSSR